jgi:hypothetical protein
MKIRYLLAFILLVPFAVNAQMGGGGMGMGRGQGGGSGGFGNNRQSSSRPSFAGAGLAGRIVDSTNNPLKGVSVILQQQDTDPNSGNPEGAPYYKEIITKKNGKFSFSELKPFHKYKLSIMAEGYRRMEKDINYGNRVGQKTAQELEDSLALSVPNRRISGTEKDLGDLHLVPIRH